MLHVTVLRGGVGRGDQGSAGHAVGAATQQPFPAIPNPPLSAVTEHSWPILKKRKKEKEKKSPLPLLLAPFSAGPPYENSEESE